MFAFLAQAVGFLGLLIVIIGFQKNTNRDILLYQIIASGIFLAHFIMLGALTGAVMNILGGARNVLFYFRDRKWANSILWMYFFIAVYIVAGILTWQNIFSLFPIVGMCIATVGYWVKNPRLTRLILLPSSPCWMIYNIATSSFAGILTESFAMTSLLVGIIRFDILKKPAKHAIVNEKVS